MTQIPNITAMVVIQNDLFRTKSGNIRKYFIYILQSEVISLEHCEKSIKKVEKSRLKKLKKIVFSHF